MVPSGTAPLRKALEEAARLRAAEGCRGLVIFVNLGPGSRLPPGKGFPECELEQHPTADLVIVGAPGN